MSRAISLQLVVLLHWRHLSALDVARPIFQQRHTGGELPAMAESFAMRFGRVTEDESAPPFRLPRAVRTRSSRTT